MTFLGLSTFRTLSRQDCGPLAALASSPCTWIERLPPDPDGIEGSELVASAPVDGALSFHQALRADLARQVRAREEAALGRQSFDMRHGVTRMSEDPSSAAWSDDPIISGADDELDRGLFAAQTALLIDGNHSPKHSVVHALLGPWGSGKSSLVNMVEEELSKKELSWTVSRFTPWSAADTNAVIADFFRTISYSVPDKNGARKSVRKYAKLATPIFKAIPFAGEALTETADRAIDTFLSDRPWQDEFAELAAELSDLDLHVLVVVDDLDRLHQDELLCVFRSIRLLGRFPGIDYLLAYDQDSVRRTLEGSDLVNGDEERALRYMEKIVQYPLSIPPVQPMHLDRIFDSGLRDIFSTMSDWKDEESQRLEETYNHILRYKLNTVRGMHRFLAQLRQYLPLLGESEINVVDYILLSFLRLHYPRLYGALPMLKARLFGNGFFSPWDRKTHKDRAKIIDVWLRETLEQLVTPEDTSTIAFLVKQMFPELDTEAFCASDRRRSISDPDYFERYFNFGIPAGDISDEAVAEAIKRISKGEPAATFLWDLLTGGDFQASSRALDKAIAASREISGTEVDPIIQFALTAYGYISPATQFLANPRYRVREWIASLLTRSMMSPLDLIAILDEQLGTLHMVKVLHRARSLATEPVPLIELMEPEASRIALDKLLQILITDNRDSPWLMANLYWAARSMGGEDDVHERIWAAIDDGTVDLSHFAAIWVTTTPDFSGDPGTIEGYDAKPLGEMMTYKGRTREESQAVVDDVEFDETDLSWKNRVKYAERFVRMWDLAEHDQA